ncbi:hypothetical protein GCM10018963_21850 [Saccharothrix longispora]
MANPTGCPAGVDGGSTSATTDTCPSPHGGGGPGGGVGAGGVVDEDDATAGVPARAGGLDDEGDGGPATDAGSPWPTRAPTSHATRTRDATAAPTASARRRRYTAVGCGPGGSVTRSKVAGRRGMRR